MLLEATVPTANGRIDERNRLLWEGHKSQGRRGGLPY